MSKSSPEDEESTPILPKPRISYFSQIFASFFASLGSFTVGSILGWSSPAHADLQDRESLGPLTDYDLMWVSISCMLGLILGSLGICFNVSKYGSRLSMIILSVPCTVGWAVMAIPRNIMGLAIGRFITGFCGGGLCVLAPLYISEISHPEVRGRLTTLGNSMLSSGIVYSYVIGSLVSWSWLSVACGAVTVLLSGSTYFYLRDSPFYLIERGKIPQARAVLRWMYGPEVTEAYIEEKMQEAQLTVQYESSDTNFLLNFLQPQNLKPFMICLTLFACQQLCGENAVVFYAVNIFTNAGSSIGPNLASIIVGASQVFFVALSSVVIDKIGRKIPMIISEAGMCVSCVALGCYIYFKDQNALNTIDGELEPSAISNLDWIPETCLIFYMIMFSIGAASLPWLLMAELCPNQVRGLLSSIVSAFCWFLALIVVGTFSPLVNLVGAYTVFWTYGALCALGCAFSIIFLPETKGKSLYEIRSCFKRQ